MTNVVGRLRKYASSQLYLLSAWLVLANLSYLIHNMAGWATTLSYLLIAPGYLLLIPLKSKIGASNRFTLSISLSVLALIVCGLLVNTLGLLGVSRPLSTFNLFVAVDTLSVALIALHARSLLKRKVLIPKGLPLNTSERMLLAVDVFMPALAIFGAIRLNNGASDLLTMILFGAISITLVWILFGRNVERLKIVTLFSMSVSILLATSLRGWHITGHDIQQEFMVFDTAYKNQLWSINTYHNPYNACLSITILPVLLAKLTAINPVYIYKAVFQILFATVTIPIFNFLQAFNRDLKTRALPVLGSFMFISFITFLNDMPYLNRQEIAFIFFMSLMLVSFTLKVPNRTKSTLTILMFLGLVLSHYSTSYVALTLFLLSALIFRILKKIIKSPKLNFAEMPKIFNLKLVFVGLLITFLWNVQLTTTSTNLSKTVDQTIYSVFNHTGAKSPDVTSSLFGGGQANTTEIVTKYVANTGENTNDIQIVNAPVLPYTRLGDYLSKYVALPSSVNASIKNFGSKAVQLLLIVGVVIMLFRIRKKSADLSPSTVAITALSLAALVLLALFTMLPVLSVQYGVLRLFQQLLPILCVPIVTGITWLFSPAKRMAPYLTAAFIIFLFVESSGFVPQLIGDYTPQISLDNAGAYYNSYYVHGSEIDASNWAESKLTYPLSMDMDYFSEIRFKPYIINGELRAYPLLSSNSESYVYQDYANVTSGLYQFYINGNVVWYRLKNPISHSLIYTNGGSNIYNE